MHTRPPGPWPLYLGNFWMATLLAKALPGDLHPIVTDEAGSTLPKPGQAPGMQQARSVSGSHLHHCHNLEGKTFPGGDSTNAQMQKPQGTDCRNGHRMEVPQLLLVTWAQQEFTLPSLPWSRGAFQFDVP